MTNTTPISLKSGDYLLIKVPEGTHHFCVHLKIPELSYFDKRNVLYGEALPPGKYELVGQALGSKIKEVEWEQVVESATNEYYTGGKDYTGNVSAFHSFTESGHSLIKSLHHIPDECVLVKIVNK